VPGALIKKEKWKKKEQFFFKAEVKKTFQKKKQ